MFKSYKILNGEDLESIAKKHNTTVKILPTKVEIESKRDSTWSHALDAYNENLSSGKHFIIQLYIWEHCLNKINIYHLYQLYIF